jgi:hypothetical protein
LVAFLIGAVIGGRLGFAKSGVRRGWLTTVAVCEAALLFLAALASISLDIGPAKPSYSLYGCDCFNGNSYGFAECDRSATRRA